MKDILKSNPFNWDEELKIEEILTTIGAEDTNLSGYYKTDGNEKISCPSATKAQSDHRQPLHTLASQQIE